MVIMMGVEVEVKEIDESRMTLDFSPEQLGRLWQNVLTW
jgi:hypothetical protein